MANRLIFDIETDGLAPTKVWCIVTLNIDSGEYTTYTEGQYDLFNKAITLADEVLGHNIIGYDIPACEKLLGTDFSACEITDTLVLSRLANPQRKAHSLGAWGESLGFPKGDYNDWTNFNPDMLAYCKQDVAVNNEMYKAVLKELKGFSPSSIELEHKVMRITQQQIRTGWLLDQPKARDLVAGLKEQSFDLEEEVQRVFKPLPTFIKVVSPKVKKDGTFSTVGLKFLGDAWTNVGGPFSRIDWPIFNLGSRQQIGRYLKHFGWKPKTFTETGHAIVSEDILKNVKGIPEAALIASYLLVGKRIAQVSSWLEAVDADTGRVHGYVNTNGAVTGRMTHSKPNLAQVPSAGSLYGPECRSCWIVDEGYKLVGIDASGLELRMLAHFMNDSDYTNEILHGDIHSKNQLAAGLPTRDKSKTFIYAFLYGAGDEKIGTIVGGGSKLGKKVKNDFLNSTPALKVLRERVVRASEKGYIKGLDGRKIWIRSGHAALNFLLQGAGAIVMKKALTILNKRAIMESLDYKFVGNIHDEFQSEVLEDHAERFGELAIESIREAGQYYELRCPLDAEAKIGNNWAETH